MTDVSHEGSRANKLDFNASEPNKTSSNAPPKRGVCVFVCVCVQKSLNVQLCVDDEDTADTPQNWEQFMASEEPQFLIDLPQRSTSGHTRSVAPKCLTLIILI